MPDRRGSQDGALHLFQRPEIKVFIQPVMSLSLPIQICTPQFNSNSSWQGGKHRKDIQVTSWPIKVT